MIQSTGIIPSTDGVSEYKNPIINVNMSDISKFSPTVGEAQVGILREATETQNASFTPIAQIGSYKYELPNPNFEAVQLAVLDGLKKDYPSVQFEIIK